MAVTTAILQPGLTLTTASAAIVTASSGSTTVLQSVFSNPTAADISLTVQIQRNGKDALTIIPARTVAAGQTCVPPELASFPLAQGDQILASGAGLEAWVNGFTVT
ncbi:hypothetical protein D3W54_14780 [Komagataeibacter medellinensis]|uniref:Uncharacterized protein n=1 Tax=Komagataeibacter medellinensis TaxID=1177712 RepID=A0ABQ6VWC3_9PROT|nr:hypothetical protein D3W54_14780 [Komagataeibacter medellinensis]